MNEVQLYDFIGIGAGPANLCLAALATRDASSSFCFLERKERYSWHPYMLFSQSRINVGYHKDLVSLVDPTNYYSFMNYLVVHNKQYEFFNAGYSRVSRVEFENYYRWVAESLPSVRMNKGVTGLRYDVKHDRFVIETGDSLYASKRVVLGTGIKPKFPEWFDSGMLNDHVFHAYNYLAKPRQYRDKNVMIVGGGQSAAEALGEVLSSEENLPQQIFWVSSKAYPVMLDENPFANEVYTPSFSQFFYDLNATQRNTLNTHLVDTSDGIHGALLDRIYQRLFYLRKTRQHPVTLTFIPLSRLVGLEAQPTGDTERLTASIRGLIDTTINNLDSVIFSTGHENCAPELLHGVKDFSGPKININPDFSIQPIDSGYHAKLFLNNGAKVTHGPADPNLSLMAWRGATIINAAFGKTLLEVPNLPHMIEWGGIHAAMEAENLQLYTEEVGEY